MQEMNYDTMKMVVTLKYYLYGYLNTTIIIFGLIGNFSAMYILNYHHGEMRKPSINIYLTVLAIFDNGVLIFSILMLNVPAITDYGQINLMTAASENDSLIDVPKLNVTSSTTTREPPYINHHHEIHMQRLLNKSLEMFVLNCFEPQNESTIVSDYQDDYWFHYTYCGMLRRLGQYEKYMSDHVDVLDHHDTSTMMMPIYRTIGCDSSLNGTIMLLDQMEQNDIQHRLAVPSQYLLMFELGIGPGQNTRDPYGILCHTLCLMTGSRRNTLASEPSVSLLVHYVKVVYPLALIAQTGSIWTTCLITVERYLAICHPFKAMALSTRTRSIYALTIVSIMAILFNLPRFAEIDTTCHLVKATDLRRNKIYYKVYYIFLNLSLNYILPLSLLSALNIKIYVNVRQASVNRNELTRARQSELHLASMLVAIVAIFIACNAPAFVVNCIEPYFEVGTPVLETLTIFSNVLVCFNSSINFVIYCIFGRKFRIKFIRLLRLDKLSCVARCLSNSEEERRQTLHSINFTGKVTDSHVGNRFTVKDSNIEERSVIALKVPESDWVAESSMINNSVDETATANGNKHHRPHNNVHDTHNSDGRFGGWQLKLKKKKPSRINRKENDSSKNIITTSSGLPPLSSSSKEDYDIFCGNEMSAEIEAFLSPITETPGLSASRHHISPPPWRFDNHRQQQQPSPPPPSSSSSLNCNLHTRTINTCV